MYILYNMVNNEVVIIHADWCGHCQALKPVIEQIQNKLKGISNAPKITLIEEAELPDKKVKLGLPEIDGYPTILRTSGGGKYESYDGQRDFNSLKDWMLKVNTMSGGKKAKKRGNNTKKKVVKRGKKTKSNKHKRKTKKRSLFGIHF
jgi:thiol-disulfide isomerase/thioredoxin